MTTIVKSCDRGTWQELGSALHLTSESGGLGQKGWGGGGTIPWKLTGNSWDSFDEFPF